MYTKHFAIQNKCFIFANELQNVLRKHICKDKENN